MLKRNLVLAGICMAAIGLVSYNAKAADVDVEASLETQLAVSLTKNNDMNFGSVEYDATHGGLIQLGTDGSTGLGGGATGLTLGGTPNAADVDVAGDGSSTIEITCESGGTLEDTSGNSLTLQNTEINTSGGVAFGSGVGCSGLGTAPDNVDLSSNPNPTILMGGEIDVSGNAIASSDTYSTTQGSGDPVTLQVVYQ